MFRKLSETIKNEKEARKNIKDKLLSFGISFLDDALRGIFPDDLILIGAPSGTGKTQFCVNLALTNAINKKRVHFIALEASEIEIERRLKYQHMANSYFKDPHRPKLIRPLNFADWLIGYDKEILEIYEDRAAQDLCDIDSLFTYYKQDKFDVNKMIENILYISDDTDLILIDHVHYFDWDDDNDNRAVKEIAKATRDIALDIQKPIILVAHLRKKDRYNKELVAGIDEFHGSSDLTKIATKIITLSPGGMLDARKVITYFRVPKNRIDGSITRYIGKVIYNFENNSYEKEYELGWAGKETFETLGEYELPYWRGAEFRNGSDSLRDHSRGVSGNLEKPAWKSLGEKMYKPNQRD